VAPLARLSSGLGAHTVAASLARFGLVGAAVAVLNYGAFLGLIWLGLPYLHAVIVGWLLVLAPSFLLNRAMTFRVKGRASAREVVAYLATLAFQVGIALAGMVVLIDGLGLSPALAYPINVLQAALSNFLLLRFVVYPLRGQSGG
jgi:putative flippase GtrA